MQNNFEHSRVELFLHGYDCNEDDLRALLQFIRAPKNLVRFQAVVVNLLNLFTAYIEPELFKEFDLSERQLERWIDLLRFLRQQMHENIPDKLEVIRASGNQQVRGLISHSPIYASLIAENLQYPAGQTEQIFSLHFIATACANGYKKLIESGEVETPTNGVSTGMLSIRKLSKESIDVPDFRYEKSLDDILILLDDWSDRQQKEKIILWAQYLRLLFSSFYERRESYRYSRQSTNQGGASTQSKKPFNHSKEVAIDDAGDELSAYIEIKKTEASQEQRQTLNELGLHAAEIGQDFSIFITDVSAPEQAGTDYRRTRQRNRGFLQAITKQAQHLPTAWSTPTPYECESLLRMLNNNQPLLKLSEEESTEVKVLVLLQFWTGRSSESLQHLILIENKQAYEALNKPCLAFLLDEECLVLPIKSAAKHNLNSLVDKRLLEQEPYSHTNIRLQDSIEVQLPRQTTELLLAVVRYRTKKPPEDNSFFRYRSEHKDWVSELIKATNKRYLTRWTEQRLALVMRHAILECVADQALLHSITEQELGHAVVAAHYQRTSVDYLQATVTQLHLWLQNWIRFGLATYQPPDRLLYALNGASVGSDLAVPDEFVKEQCAHYKHKLKHAKAAFFGAERTLQVHNTLVAYIISWLGFASGYRAVTDPLSNSRHLDRKTGLLVISDKDDQYFTHSRLVQLPRGLLEQLDFYVMHLESLARRFFDNDKLQENINALCRGYIGTELGRQEIPFLFFFTENNEVLRVSPKTLLEVNPTKLPINHNRHYLRSKLSELQAPVELIDYHMGHWEHGEEPYQKFSSISPLEIANELGTYLEEISTSIGWTPQGGLVNV